jgi:hypothetical protein
MKNRIERILRLANVCFDRGNYVRASRLFDIAFALQVKHIDTLYA